MYFPFDSMSPCKQTTFPINVKWSEYLTEGHKPVPDLLEVSSKPVHVLVIGKKGVVLSMEEVDVPDPQQR